MQYNFISNITSNGVKGSAILGIFSDLSVNSLSKSINATNLKKLKLQLKNQVLGARLMRNYVFMKMLVQNLKKFI